MLNMLKEHVEDVKSSFDKKDVVVAIVGISVIIFACFLNHNFL